MNAQTIDQEFDKLQKEFQDVAATVQGLAAKLQAAEKSGDANAAQWLSDLKDIAQDIDDEQAQTKALLLSIHSFIGGVAQSQDTATAAPPVAEKPPLFAPGHEPQDFGEEQSVAQQPGHHGLVGGVLGGLMSGGLMGGGRGFGGYYGGGFGQAMEMGVGMRLGADLVNNIFH
jgi:hypothetical protein